MKTLLAIVLVALVYVAGFCDANAPRIPTAPTAPGVVSPGGKNFSNPDVPHIGDDMVAVATDNDNFVYFIDTTSFKNEEDGIKSIVVMIVNPGGDARYGGAHRMAGRAKFDCGKKTHLDGPGFILSDEGDIVATTTEDSDWTPVKFGSIAAAVAAVVCHEKQKLAPGSVEL